MLPKKEKKLKVENRMPIQVSQDTHTVLKAVKEVQDGIPLGKIVDRLVRERYPNMYKESK